MLHKSLSSDDETCKIHKDKNFSFKNEVEAFFRAQATKN